MLTQIVIGSILTQVLILVVFWFFIGRRHLQMTRVYPLYAVRDKFVYFVASGKLQEDDPLFKYFYKATNIIIPNSKVFTLRKLIEALEETRKKGYDLSDEKKLEEIKVALDRVNDDQVKDAVLSFYRAVFFLMIKNSSVLRISTWLNSIPIPGITLPRLTRFQKTAGSTFDRFQNACIAMGCPA